MSRYKISLHYPNGSRSHEFITTSAAKAHAWCMKIFRDYDLREVASKLLVMYGERVLFDAPPASVAYDESEKAICWPTKIPRRMRDCQRATVTLPGAVLAKAGEIGQGNVSKGLLEMVIASRPELKVMCFTEAGVTPKP